MLKPELVTKKSVPRLKVHLLHVFFSPLCIYIYILNFRGGAMYQNWEPFSSVVEGRETLLKSTNSPTYGKLISEIFRTHSLGSWDSIFPPETPRNIKKDPTKKVHPEPIFVNRVIVIAPFFSRGPNDLGETRLFMGTHLTNTSNGTRASPASMAGGIRSTCVGSVEKVSDEKRAPGYWLCRGDILPITRVVAHFSLDDILAIGYIYLLGDCTT